MAQKTEYEKNIIKGKIANAITSAAKNHIVATTDDLYDVNFEEYQDEINKKTSDDIISVKSNISGINREIADIHGDITNVKNDITVINGEINGIHQDITSVNNDIVLINGEITGIRGDVSEMNSDIDNLEENVEDIKNEMVSVQSGITEVKNNVTEISNEITEINEDLSRKIEKSIFDTISSRTPAEKDRDFVYRDENDNILVVDKKNSGGSNVWVKITDTADYTSGGKYLFVREANNVAFNSASSPIDVDGNVISVAITDNKIAFDQATDGASFIISDIDGGVSILSSGGHYIGRTQNSNGVESSQETAYVNTLSFDENGNVVITSSGGPKLQKNSSGNRFRYFKSAQHLIQLYKKVESSTPDEFKWKRLISNDDININAITTEELDEILIPQCIPGNKMDC